MAAASPCKVNIYGEAVTEVGGMFLDKIKRTRSADLRAINYGEYAVYLLEQIYNSESDITFTLRKAAQILEDVLKTLENTEKNRLQKYHHITKFFRKKLADAHKLLGNE